MIAQMLSFRQGGKVIKGKIKKGYLYIEMMITMIKIIQRL